MLDLNFKDNTITTIGYKYQDSTGKILSQSNCALEVMKYL